MKPPLPNTNTDHLQSNRPWPVNPIYASGLSRSCEFFDELGHYAGMPFHAFQFDGAIVPMFHDGPIWNSPVELLLASSNFFVAVNEVPFNVRNFCLSIHEQTGEAVCVSDIGSDFHEGHGLSEEDCFVLEAPHFWLPQTHEAYMDSLDHDDRKTIRRLHARNAHLEIVYDGDVHDLWMPMRSFYRDRMVKHFGYSVAMAERITGTVDISLRHMAKLGTALVLGVFSGSRQVAVSIFERSRGCVFHYTDVTDPSYESNLCRFAIAKGVEYAIQQGDVFFDIGHLWEDDGMGCDFSFKRCHVPKCEKRKNRLLCFTLMTHEGRSHFFAKNPHDKLFAPFYLDGKLILDHHTVSMASEAQMVEHRTFNAEVVRSTRTRGTILNISKVE